MADFETTSANNAFIDHMIDVPTSHLQKVFWFNIVYPLERWPCFLTPRNTSVFLRFKIHFRLAGAKRGSREKSVFI